MRVAMLLLVMCSLQAIAQESPMHYSIKQYLNIRAAGSGSLSPDGKQLAFITNVTGIPQAWLVPTAGGWPKQITFTDDAVRSVRWSPDGKWILFTMDTKGDERTQFYLVRPDGSEVIALTKNPKAIHSFGDWSSDASKICYSSNERDERYFDVYVMDVRSRKAQRVFEHDGNNYAHDFSPDGKRVLFTRAKGSLDDDLYVLELRTKNATHVTPHEGTAVFHSAHWSAGGKTIYMLTDLNRVFVNLARIDVASQKLNFVRNDSWDVESLAMTRDGKRLASSINRDGYSEVWIQSGPSRFRLEQMQQGVAHNLRFSQDGRLLSFDFNGAQNNSDVWVYDIARKKLAQVTHSDRAGIPQSSFVKPRLVRYDTFDGRRIPAWFYLPKGAKRDGSLPVIIYIHGGPESQTRTDFNSIIQYFVNRGYAILAPNVRGSTGYGKSFHHLDDKRKRMDSVRDAAMAVEYLKSSGYAHPKKIACMGGSYGGFMVLSLVTTYPDLWAAGADLFGIANFISFFKNTGPYRRALRASEYGDPDTDADFLREISPINHVDKIRAPMIIIQGVTDPRVPKEESDQMVGALRKRNVSVEYVVFPDEGHGIVKLQNRIKAYGAIAEFLDRQLK